MIVCMSRRICVDLYNAIVEAPSRLARRRRRQGRDQGRDDRLGRPTRSTGSRTSATRRGARTLAKRFKDPDDPLKLVIVRDMWLTGFDAPCLHTMYVDKPMRGHGLMQAIARVNRVFRDKPAAWWSITSGLADQLKQALADYTESGDRGETGIDQEEAVAVLLEKYEVVRGDVPRLRLLGRLQRQPRRAARRARRRAMNIILETDADEDRQPRTRFINAVSRAVEGVRPGRARTTRRWRSATRSASSRPSGRRWPRTRRRAGKSPTRTWTTRSARSSRRPSRPTR